MAEPKKNSELVTKRRTKRRLPHAAGGNDGCPRLAHMQRANTIENSG
jgi:hypothetical protein